MKTRDIEPFIFSDAVRQFWRTRAKQEARGTADQGSRSAVTGGQQMN